MPSKRLLGTGASDVLREHGSHFAVVIALHVLQVGWVMPLLVSYFQGSRAGWFVWSVLSGLVVFPWIREWKGMEVGCGKKDKGGGGLRTLLLEVEVRWIGEWEVDVAKRTWGSVNVARSKKRRIL